MTSDAQTRSGARGDGDEDNVALDAGLYERTHILLGDRGIAALRATAVFVAGAGGVGGHCAEALARAGVGHLTLLDDDVVCASNKNRQVIALDSTLGAGKAVTLAARLRDINPHCHVVALARRVTPDNADALLREHPCEFVVDCIDSVESKVALLAAAVRLRRRVYASGGAGGRVDPTRMCIGDVFDTHNDRLSRACRIGLRKRGIGAGAITWVCSTEKGKPPRKTHVSRTTTAATTAAATATATTSSNTRNDDGNDDVCVKYVNGTISYMPAIFGLTLASAVLRCAVDTAAHDAAVQLQRKRQLKREKRQLHKRHKRERAAAAAAAAAAHVKGGGHTTACDDGSDDDGSDDDDSDTS